MFFVPVFCAIVITKSGLLLSLTAVIALPECILGSLKYGIITCGISQVKAPAAPACSRATESLTSFVSF